MSQNDWKRRLGVVYSTDPDFAYTGPAQPQPQTLPPSRQDLRVRLDRKGRGGKVVTVVSGFVGSEEALNELGRMLRARCGTGGSAKDGQVLVQGDCCQRVIGLLADAGYRVKRSGG